MCFYLRLTNIELSEMFVGVLDLCYSYVTVPYIHFYEVLKSAVRETCPSWWLKIVGLRRVFNVPKNWTVVKTFTLRTLPTSALMAIDCKCKKFAPRHTYYDFDIWVAWTSYWRCRPKKEICVIWFLCDLKSCGQYLIIPFMDHAFLYWFYNEKRLDNSSILLELEPWNILLPFTNILEADCPQNYFSYTYASNTSRNAEVVIEFVFLFIFSTFHYNCTITSLSWELSP